MIPIVEALNDDRAYVLGAFLGGGTITDQGWIIEMPFEKWGLDPRTASGIAIGILQQIRDRFHSYAIDINFRPAGKRWHLFPIGAGQVVRIQDHLRNLGLPTSGTILDHAEVVRCRKMFTDSQGGAFLAGFFDVRASVEASHRRHTDLAPIVSIEIPGRTNNFGLVVGLCAWMTARGSVTDQILFNHPSQHSAANPDYTGWKKGFKIRILARTFLKHHHFVLHPKCDELVRLAGAQRANEQRPCTERLSAGRIGAVSIHRDIGCTDFPDSIRGSIFLHYHHICAAMGCPFAPLEEVKAMVTRADELVTVGPICAKMTLQDGLRRWESNFGATEYPPREMSVDQLLARPDALDFPGLKEAVAYLFATGLNGLRHRGKASDIIARNRGSVVGVCNSRGSAVLLINNRLERAVIISRAGGAISSKAAYVSGIRIKVYGVDSGKG